MSLYKIKVVAFDADDTLWVNEPYFRETERKFAEITAPYANKKETDDEHYKVILDNLPMYGYGVKSNALNLIECAYNLSGGTLPATAVMQIIELCKEQMSYQVQLLDHVKEVLEHLKGKYRLVVATKGDLVEQQSKLDRSGILHYFEESRIVSEKTSDEYIKYIEDLNTTPDEFVMIGNSFKSDILPVLEIGASAMFLKNASTWHHEKVKEEKQYDKLYKIEQLSDVIALLQ